MAVDREQYSPTSYYEGAGIKIISFSEFMEKYVNLIINQYQIF